MPFEIISRDLDGLLVLEPCVFEDERGFFMESFRENELEAYGVRGPFVQDNHSRSQKGVLRGLHFQWDPPQGKLIRVTRGSAYVVEVDIRCGSPTLGKYKSYVLSSENKHILWVPAGFANGFCSLEDDTEMQYKCTAYWNPHGESGILWNDPDIAAEWPVKEPLVSKKDSSAQTLAQWLQSSFSEKLVY